MHLLRRNVLAILPSILMVLLLLAPAAHATREMTPADEQNNFENHNPLTGLNSNNEVPVEQKQVQEGNNYNNGFGMGNAQTDQNWNLQKVPQNVNFEASAEYKYAGALRQYDIKSLNNGDNETDVGMYNAFMNQNRQAVSFPSVNPSFFQLAEGQKAGGGGGGSFSGLSGLMKMSLSNTGSGLPGIPESQASAAATAGTQASAGAEKNSEPNTGTNQAKSDGMAAQGARASSAGEDAIENMIGAYDAFLSYLINVANENAGSPCSAHAITKTYANVVYMVQKMYHKCYVPMAVLFLLPGAVITNTKTLVSFGFLNARDDDSPSPFTGIMRSVIAIFLIPATQLTMSYVIDVGNALEDATSKYVSIPLIMLWMEEQVQVLDPDQQGGILKNLPNVPLAPYRGKFANMPVAGAQLEQMSGLDLALMELVNEIFHMMSIGLDVLNGFQLVFMCYLFLLGPLAAAFFAWPSVGRDLFRRTFGAWVDGVVLLALWKFWWNIVLICMTARLESGLVNPFNYFEVYYVIAFFAILMVVPFNPFDFKAGEIVSFVLMHAEGVAAKVAQGGKGGGSGGGGTGGGGKSRAASKQAAGMG